MYCRLFCVKDLSVSHESIMPLRKSNSLVSLCAFPSIGFLHCMLLLTSKHLYLRLQTQVLWSEAVVEPNAPSWHKLPQYQPPR